MIYITSDLHFGHDKKFIYEARGFSSVHEHNEAVIDNWNSIVREEDDVYVLGDLVLNDLEAGIACIRRLRGRIHIVRGNHDSNARISEYKKLPGVVEVVDAMYLKHNGLTYYLSHYPTIVANSFGELVIKREVINLFGHTHSSEKLYRFPSGEVGLLMYNVSLDAHSCYPISIDDVEIEIFEQWG